MIHVSRITPLPDDLNLVRIRQIANMVFSSQKFSGDASIIFTDNKSIQKLNRDYRDIDAATDVLSFPSEEIDPDTSIRYIGDVIISTEKALTQSKSANRSHTDELTMLIVHGCLHLTGLDHATQVEKNLMKMHQEDLLKIFGVENSSWPEEEQ
jgi:probable rRNA maturation factor